MTGTPVLLTLPSPFSFYITATRQCDGYCDCLTMSLFCIAVNLSGSKCTLCQAYGCLLAFLQLWKDLEGQAKDALKQATQQIDDVQQAQDEAARLRWTAETAQRSPLLSLSNMLEGSDLLCTASPQALYDLARPLPCL